MVASTLPYFWRSLGSTPNLPFGEVVYGCTVMHSLSNSDLGTLQLADMAWSRIKGEWWTLRQRC
jgi:hypothetical protein